MFTFFNFFISLLCFFLIDGATDAHAAPVFAAIVAVTKFVSALGIIGKLLLTVGLAIGQTLLQKALAKKNKNPDQKQGVELEVKMGDDVAVSAILGTYATAGKRKYIGTWGNIKKTPNAYLVDVIEISNIPQGDLVELWVNDKKCTLTPNVNDANGLGHPIPEFTKEGTPYAWWKYYDGSQEEADPYLIAKFGTTPEHPWKSTMIGRGCAYIILTYRLNDEYFSNSLPAPLIVTNGAPLYDIRKDSSMGGSGPQRWDDPSTYAPSDNPLVQAYNIARGIYYNGVWFYGGQNVTAKRLPTSAWVAAMNACDVLRGLDGGGSEPMFRSGVEFKGSDEPLEVIDNLRAAANGRIFEIGGKLKPAAGQIGAAEMSISDGDIIITEGQNYEPFPNLDDTHNGATATYPEPKEKWANKDAPPYYSPELETKDGQRRLVAALQFPCAPYPVQVQALLRAAVEEGRRFRTHQFYLPPMFWALEPGDIIAWSSSVMGYINKKFIVVSIEGELTYNQFVTLREVDPTDYAWTPGFELPAPTTTPGPIILPTQIIDGWSVAAYAVMDNDGRDRRPAILVAVADDLDGVSAIRIRVRVKTTGELIHDQTYPYVTYTTYQWVISNSALIGGEDYEVQGLIIPTTPRPVDWTVWTSVTMFPLLITTDDFLNESVTAEKIKDAAITAEKLMNEAVTNIKLAAQAVDTAKLAIAAVTSEILANQAVIDTKLADAAVTGRALAQGAVDATKFAQGIEPVTVIQQGQPLPTTKTTANVTYNGQLYTWNGTQYVSGALGDGSVTAAKLADAAVTANKLANGAVTHDKISANSIYGDVIAAKAITARELVLTNFENIVDMGWSEGNFAGWTAGTGHVAYLDGRQDAGLSAWWGQSKGRDCYVSKSFTVSPGETFYFSAWVFNDYTGGNANLYVFNYKADDTYVSSSQVPGATTALKSQWVKLEGRYTVPAGVSKLRMAMQVERPSNDANTALATWARPYAQRASDAMLIVDGSILTDKLAANVITAAKIAAGAIGVDQLAANAVTAAKLAAASITADKLAVGTGGNLLLNSDFSAGLFYWGAEYVTAPAGTWDISYNTATFAPVPNGAMQLHYTGNVANTIVGARPYNADGTVRWFSCTPGDWYELSAKYFGHRCNAYQLWICFADKDQNVIQFVNGFTAPANQNFDPVKNIANYAQGFMKAQAPANAVQMFQFVRNAGPISGQSDPYVWTTQLFLGKCNPNQTAASPWADGSWTEITGGAIAALSITAMQIATRTISADRIATGAVTANELAANSVTGVKIAGLSITGDKIAANTITGDKIVANSITAKQLILTNWENIVDNGWSEGNLDGWIVSGQQAWYNETSAGAWANGWTFVSNERDQAVSKKTYDVTPGEVYYYSAWCYNASPNYPASVMISLSDASGTQWSYPGTITQVKNQWVKIEGQVTIGSPFVKARFYLFSDRPYGAGGGNVTWAKPTFRRAMTGELIVDGAITAGKISVNQLAAISATLGSVNISSAVIGTLQVGTSNIQTGAITQVSTAQNGGTVAIGQGGDVANVLSTAVTVPSSGNGNLVLFTCKYASQNPNTLSVYIYRNDVLVRTYNIQDSINADKTFSASFCDIPGAGTFTYRIRVLAGNGQGQTNLYFPELIVITYKR